MKVLVTGANGQLGQALKAEVVLYPYLEAIFLSKKELDISSLDSIEKAISIHKPNIIINTAAYTAVDNAEDNQEQAYLINAKALENVAAICKSYDVKLIHISTDYVFDGNKSTGYSEEDITNPQSVYGLSKLAGEKAILDKEIPVYAIIRTSWLYSIYGTNFVKTMLRIAKERKEISVVNDQVGNPTYANDLATVILKMTLILDQNTSGIYHYTNTGNISWYTFASKIFEFTKNDIVIKPVLSDQFPTKAKRPRFSVLETAKIQKQFDFKIASWEVSLKKMMTSL